MKFFVHFLFVLSVFAFNFVSAAQISHPIKKSIPPVLGTIANTQAINPGLTFGFNLNTRYTIQAEKQADGSRNEYITYEFIPVIKTQDYRFRAVADFYYFVKDQKGNDWDNTSLEATLNTPWSVSSYFDLKPEILVAVPFFKQTSDFNNYVGGRLTLMLNSKNLNVPDLLLRYGVQFGKLSFKNEKTGNDYNIDTRLRQRVHLGYQFTDALSAMIYFHYDSNFLLDNSIKNSFYHETFFEYTINSFANIDLGVANGGGVYAGENQEVDNLKFYNETSSEIFIQLGLSI